MGRANGRPERRLRVRSKSLKEIDETKLSLALWLMAERMLKEEEEADPEQRGGM